VKTTTLLFACATAITFVAWYVSEKSLSIHAIDTARRETFYWLALLFICAFGAAAADWVAERLALDYLVTAILFGALMGMAALAYERFHLRAMVAFWITYVLTRALGAAIGDFLSHPSGVGGLGVGAAATSALLLAALAGLVIYLSVKHKKLPEERASGRVWG
jgi:uncharacterized membrane-anchored protein